VTDHKQSFRDTDSNERRRMPSSQTWTDEENQRFLMRQKLFPDLTDDVIIFANFNQLYKIDPSIFAAWLRILREVPNSVLWLLRFPPAGEEHLLRTAKAWSSAQVASRIRFTHVAKKNEHIRRARVADIFLDTIECNAHTVAADVLWSGTPIITWPKYDYKMCSRVGASIAHSTGFGDQMITYTLEEYEERAIALARSVSYSTSNAADGTVKRTGSGELTELRRQLFFNRDSMPLFDTQRWTRNLEKGYEEAWKRWVHGTSTEESAACGGESGCIWIRDEPSEEQK